MTPFWVSDLSKRDLNLFTSSGFNGGTLTGPGGGGLAVEGRDGGASVRPSNRGKGPAIQQNYPLATLSLRDLLHGHSRCKASSSVGARPACACPINLRTIEKPEGVRRPRFSLSAICHICNTNQINNPSALNLSIQQIGTYQSKCLRGKFRLFEKGDSDFARDNTEIRRISRLEKLVEHPLFLRREIEVWSWFPYSIKRGFC